MSRSLRVILARLASIARCGPGATLVTDAGTVTFRVTGNRKGTRMLIGGQFSATYAMRDGAWRIVSHSLETLPLAYAQTLPAHSDTSRPN